VAIQIYDAHGTRVRKLDLGQKSAGTYLTRDAAAYWDGRNDYGEALSSGMYFYQLRADEFSATRRMILAK
jgi:flagellar hook assembly protein FlgD